MSTGYLTRLQIIVTSADPAAAPIVGEYDIHFEGRHLLADAAAAGLALFHRAVPGVLEHACAIQVRSHDMLLTPSTDPLVDEVRGQVRRRAT